MTLKETPKEMNRLKSNRSAKNSIYALLIVHYLTLLFRHGHACARNPCTGSMPESMPETTELNIASIRYTKSLTPNPIVAVIQWLVPPIHIDALARSEITITKRS